MPKGSVIAPYQAEHSSQFEEYPAIEAYIEKLDALPEVQAPYNKAVPPKLWSASRVTSKIFALKRSVNREPNGEKPRIETRTRPGIIGHQMETVKQKQRRRRDSWSISPKELLVQMHIYPVSSDQHHRQSRQTFRTGIGRVMTPSDTALTLIREIVHAMPEPEMIHFLFEVFVTRCQGSLGNVVHTSTFMKQAEEFCNCLKLTPASRVLTISSTFSMETLGCYLLALVLGLAFHPTPSQLGWSPTPLTLRVEEFRASGLRSKTLRSLSLRCLRDGVSLFCGSIAGLQAAIMLLLDGQEGSVGLDAVLVTAISGARKLGLHRLGDIKLDASASHSAPLEIGTSALVEPPHIRTEIGIRIWWALLQRDWSRGQALGYYTVHPSQFNTRMPLHINDHDLCLSTRRVSVNVEITERPRSEFTTLSYTVHAIELATIVRESIDLWGSATQRPDATAESARFRKHLNNRYEKYVAGLPSYFRLGNTVGLMATGPMAAIPVQRWMLHQQLWSLLLRLLNLSCPIGPAFRQLLTRNIIGTQAQIQARCAVCGTLSTSETQLFNAAVVLLLDLLFTSKQARGDSSSANLSRLISRDNIREAIELLRTKTTSEGSSQVTGSAQRSADALEALMKLEEEYSDNSAKGPLRLKVADIIRGLGGRADPATAPVQEQQASFDAFSPFSASMPFANVGDGFPGLDVLPILSNGLSPNFWQFLDSSPAPFDGHAQKVSSATPGDLPGSLGVGTSQFAISYSSAPVTRMTHTNSPRQSGPMIDLEMPLLPEDLQAQIEFYSAIP